MSNGQFHLTPNNLARIMGSVSDRDIQIILTLAKVRFATAQHIRRLHFASGTPLSNVRVCHQVLARLFDLHVVVRLDRQIGGARAGSSAHVYRLDRAGQVIALRHSDQAPKSGVPGGMFMTHNLAVTELYVACQEAEAGQRFIIRRFDLEPQCWRRTTSMTSTSIKPDAYIQLSAGGYRYFWFVEMDMATEAGIQIRKKMQKYVQYWSTGREQAAERVFPGVVYLVPHDRRKAQVQREIDRLPERHKRLFRVALQSEALPTLTGGPSL